MSHSEEGRMYMGEVISAIDKVCEIKSLDSGFRVVKQLRQRWRTDSYARTLSCAWRYQIYGEDYLISL